MLIEQIQVKGYKSLVDATLHVKPLTLLAGTNSSGKSSIMQPLLLIKQTIEAPYQPASALVLDGAHVQAETSRELVGKIKGSLQTFSIRIVEQEGKVYRDDIELSYQVDKSGFSLLYQDAMLFKEKIRLTPMMSWSEIEAQLVDSELKFFGFSAGYGKIISDSAFLRLRVFENEGFENIEILDEISFTYNLSDLISALIHIPGLRGLPKRAYPATFFQKQVKGTFDFYAAGTVSQWQKQENFAALIQLNNYLSRLGLTDSIAASEKNANEVELMVSRLPVGTKGKIKKTDMVNIADVGIGVSQVLPILVALIAAQEGQIVYVEQPELHLHPRAQVAMAELLAEAANRGVRVIVETHSSLLLLTIQTLIAQEKIKNTDVALHWFARDAKGATQVTYVQPDEDGAYGEWPEDFGDVELKAQDAYLTAVGMRHFGKAAQ
jgi:predicted ATPase